MLAVAAPSLLQTPGEEREIFVPFELVMTVETDGAGAELPLMLLAAAEAASLAAEEGAKNCTYHKYEAETKNLKNGRGRKLWIDGRSYGLHILILS